MASVLIIGAGFAGHTAALYLGDELGKEHQITVVNKYDYFGYVPSWVWVGVGTMGPYKTIFDLEAVYRKKNVTFRHAVATEVHPDENYVMISPIASSEPERVDYDYLVIATGPRLDFEATEGLGPRHGHTRSICTLDHAKHARDSYLQSVAKMERGERQKLVIGTGHPSATCQGAAFEYIANLHKDLLRRGVRDKAELVWLSNESEVGDFGVRGVEVKQGGRMVGSDEFIGALFADYEITAEVQKGVIGVDEKEIAFVDYDDNQGSMDYDFAMLIPRFLGVGLDFVGADGSDVSDKIANPSGFIKVDATYGLDWDTLVNEPEAWPSRYQNPNYPNIFAAGIAFAPPGPISVPHTTPAGISITAAPPRTGMVSGVIGRLVAKNISEQIRLGEMSHRESMTEMAAACIASMGDSMWDGSAATILIYPVVPDLRRYPNTKGRDPSISHMEMGLSGAWLKRLLHSTFIYKLQARPGWKIIPE